MPIIGIFGAAAAAGFGYSKGGVAFDVDYLVIAGGGGANWIFSGGGGAGGYRTSYPGGTKLTITEKETTVTIGGGGL